MPSKLPHPCNYPGCPERTTERYCPYHKSLASREYDQYRRRPGHNQTYDTRWRKIRNAYIARHPLCELCEAAGRLTPAAEVHHKLPLDQGGTHAENNLQSLCKPCHSRITVSETNRDLS